MPTNVEFKDIFAFVPLFVAIFNYFKPVQERLRHAQRAARTYELGWTYSAINIWPHRFHTTATFIMMTVSILYISTKFFSGIQQAPYIGTYMKWVGDNYWYFFLAWLLLVFVAFFRLLESFALWVFGIFPGSRNTVGWANARWHIRDEPGKAPLLAVSEVGITRIANQVIAELVTQPANPNLALRPDGIDNADAANMLYFGHVVESYAAATSGPKFPWTSFYTALARVATSDRRPFSPNAISQIDLNSNSFMTDVIVKINEHSPEDFPYLKDEPALEERIHEAIRILRLKFKSDARNLGHTLFGTSYRALLRSSRLFLKSEGMRRQFGKLAILWGVLDRARHPDVFEVPFNNGIFLLYLNEDVLLTESERFERNDPGVRTCFECAQKRLMKKVFTLLKSTRQKERVQWLQEEKKTIQEKGGDWQWWLLYRADQHTYHLGKRQDSA